MAGFLVSILIFGLIVAAVVAGIGRATRGRSTDEDSAVSVRRLFVYLLLLAALAISATGIAALLEIVFDTGASLADRGSAREARGVSFVLVGVPSFVLLFRYLLGRLAADPRETASPGWRLYLNITLGVSLITAMVGFTQPLGTAAGLGQFEPAALAWAIVASAVWTLHWFGPPRRYHPDDGFHLAVGSLAGLGAVAGAVAVLLTGFGEAIYDALVDAPLAETPASDQVKAGVIGLIVGGPVWWWHWLSAERVRWTPALWNTYIMLAGVLAPVLVLVGSAAGVLGGILVWFFGDPERSRAADHFDFLPIAIALIITGAVTWAYHRRVLEHSGTGRTEATRAYEYVVAAVGLLATATGVTILLVAFFQAIGPETAAISNGGESNTLIAAITALLVGAPLWWRYWMAIDRHRREEPAVEVASPSRRVYTFALFGVAAVVAFVSLIVAAFIFLEDLFEGTLSGDTLLDVRVAIALVITAGLVAAYHFTVYRADGEVADAAPRLRRTRVVVVAVAGSPLARSLAEWEAFDVRERPRRDDPGPYTGSVDGLAGRIAALDADEVLVVVGGGDDAVVVALER